jgi:flagellar protein FlbD
MLSGKAVYVNPYLIETMESTPDTMLTLTTGKKLMVRETPEQVSDCFRESTSGTGVAATATGEEPAWT